MVNRALIHITVGICLLVIPVYNPYIPAIALRMLKKTVMHSWIITPCFPIANLRNVYKKISEIFFYILPFGNLSFWK